METEKEGMIMESPSKESISIYRNGEWVIYHSASSIAQLATDGREELEKQNEYFQDLHNEDDITMSKQREQITALQSSLKEKDQEIERLKELLSRLEDYFDDRADVQDGDSEDYIPRPNTEMSYLSEIRDLL
jgi:uncharacterized coiled-coil protein SlyX